MAGGETLEQPGIAGQPTDPIRAGWAALSHAAWDEARACFDAAVVSEPTAEAWEGLSWAAFWQNDAPALFDALERAYAMYREAGDRAAAARVAAWIATDHVDFRGEMSVARGWLGRARRLLEGLEPCAEHGWVSVHEGEKHIVLNDTAAGRQAGAYAAELGRRLGDIDLEVMGLATEGLALVTEGNVDEGMARLDEAAAAAFGGELKQIWASAWCGCYMMYACERVRDYGRAAEWCRKIEEWSISVGSIFVNRVCRAHYAGVLIWSGAWSKAEEMLVDSERRLAVVRPPIAGEASVRLGELRWRQGRLDEAEDILEGVSDHPLALIGIGEICLERDDAAGARDRARQYLRDLPSEIVTLRARGLELLARACAALAEHDDAVAARDELQGMAQRIATEPLLASAALAAGVVAAARGDFDHAQTELEDATRLYHRSGAPFEAARARIELARVFAAMGRQRDALRELQAAATSLQRVGAVREAARAQRLARDIKGEHSANGSPLTRREREVLQLVAAGKSDRAIAEALVLSEHTVHRHVANILGKLDCSSRSAAVAEAVRQALI